MFNFFGLVNFYKLLHRYLPNETPQLSRVNERGAPPTSAGAQQGALM